MGRIGGDWGYCPPSGVPPDGLKLESSFRWNDDKEIIVMLGITRQGLCRAREVKTGNDSTTNVTPKRNQNEFN